MTQRVEAEGKKNPESRHLWDDGSEHDAVTKIIVRGDSTGILYIWFDYLKSGKWREGSFYGYKSQGFTQTFEIDHLNDEQLLSVEGYYEPKLAVIKGIQFITSLRISEMIGFAEDCTKFSLSVDGKKIIGFHGSSSSVGNDNFRPGEYLQSLGAYFTWITPIRLEAEGGKEGRKWDDEAGHEGVTKINVGGGREGIQCIKFDYIKNGQHIYGSDHGFKGKGFTYSFEIDHLKKEYLVSVEGYYDSGVIQGLEFKTNIKTSGLIGYDDGKKFRLAANGKKIIGFHGHAEKNVNSLGAYFTASTPFTKLESRGCSQGKLWDDGALEGVRKVYVTYNFSYVVRVTFFYDYGGKIIREQHGSSKGQEGEFEVDYPNEFIISVEGTLTNGTQPDIGSLTFKTSKGRTSSTFGSATNREFLLESKGCGIVGFHGFSSSNVIHGLGAYFRPLPTPPEVEKVEPKGGDRGIFWDDGGFDGIGKIYIGLSQDAIAFIKFMYYKDERMVFGDDHGKNTLLFSVQEFEVDYPSEYIIAVEGNYDDNSGAITMLRFQTNKQISRDFGIHAIPNFLLQRESHMIVGFHGKSSSNLLHQIGVHVIPM